jgi:hypothetical protein
MLPGLLSQSRSRRSGAEVTSEDRPPNPFNEVAFYDKLLKFIIANDQVCFVASMLHILMRTFSSLCVSWTATSLEISSPF